jgi:hypothetical protein
MVTNTPVGVLRAVVILPSCLDFMVVHRLLRQTSTWRDNGRNELVTEDCAWITGKPEAMRSFSNRRTVSSSRSDPEEKINGRAIGALRPPRTTARALENL